MGSPKLPQLPCVRNASNEVSYAYWESELTTNDNPGHYSYECVAQDRPYAPRPSRTQQLLNPKLVPKITAEVPKSVVPQLDSSRKRNQVDLGLQRDPSRAKRVRSVSSSSRSVSTISTRSSSSPSLPPKSQNERLRTHVPVRQDRYHEDSPDQQPTSRNTGRRRDRSFTASRSRSTSPHGRPKRSESLTHKDQSQQQRSGRIGRHRERSSTASRSRSNSRGRHDRSKDAEGPSRRHRSRSLRQPYIRDEAAGVRSEAERPSKQGPAVRRDRSLSPYSKRVAMSKTGG